jgi:hypothetical protein
VRSTSSPDAALELDRVRKQCSIGGIYACIDLDPGWRRRQSPEHPDEKRARIRDGTVIGRNCRIDANIAVKDWEQREIRSGATVTRSQPRTVVPPYVAIFMK